MWTEFLCRLSANVLLATALLFTGCSKESDEFPTSSVTEPIGQPKDDNPSFLLPSDPNGTFRVLRWNPNCADFYGTITSYPAVANNANILNTTPAYLRVQSGTSPGDNTFCRLQIGNNAGDFETWGPWYYIWPQFGPSASVRKGLKIRIKRTLPLFLPANAYNVEIFYNGASNQWSTDDATGSGRFEVAVLAGIPSTACPPR